MCKIVAFFLLSLSFRSFGEAFVLPSGLQSLPCASAPGALTTPLSLARRSPSLAADAVFHSSFRGYQGELPRGRGSWSLRASASPSEEASELKAELLERVFELKRLQERDGKASIDFGVKGGELDEKTRAPRNLADDGAPYNPKPCLTC